MDKLKRIDCKIDKLNRIIFFKKVILWYYLSIVLGITEKKTSLFSYPFSFVRACKTIDKPISREKINLIVSRINESF